MTLFAEQSPLRLMIAVAAMAAVVVASNILVQVPVDASLGGIALADLLTWGAFTYPFAFLVTDLTNRRFGPAAARKVVYVGFVVAFGLSLLLANPRIAVASGTAFLVGQLLDVTIFDYLRRSTAWWRAPFVSSLVGSAADTVIFFSLAFAPAFVLLGANDPFAIEASPLLTVGPEALRFWSWAIADFAVKLSAGLLLLAPYRLLMHWLAPAPKWA